MNYLKSPYKKIPVELINDYTINKKIQILKKFKDGSKKNGVIWDDKLIKYFYAKFTPENIKANNEGHYKYNGTKFGYGHIETLNLLNTIEKYNITNINVAVVGSEFPWIEAILLNLKNKVTTIDYNIPKCKFKNLSCYDYFNFFKKNKNIFDVIISYSSIEHSGLGRYGDPLDPNGDLKAINDIYNNLKENGLLILSVPIGKDALVWNCHRIYGYIRLPLLFKKFEEIEWIDNRYKNYKSNDIKNSLLKKKLTRCAYQPVIVLKKKYNN